MTKKEEKRPTITDIFPGQDVSDVSSSDNQNTESRRPSTKRHGSRIRTISEHQPSRFQLTPIKKRLAPIPRNSSAPHFIDANKIMPRNVSTPGFARQNSSKYSTQLSQEDNTSHVLFGIECGSNTQLSNTQLYLEPATLSRRGSSRRSSGPMVRPFSRKDLFYGGSIMNLVDKQELPTNFDQCRHSIISTPR